MGRILIIDDEPAVRTMLRSALERQGHEVVEARNSADGVAQYEFYSPGLVIMDILMPDGEGLEGILELRRIDPQVAVFAISGGNHLHATDVLHTARGCGARRTFEKPLDLAEFLAAVDDVLRRRDAA